MSFHELCFDSEESRRAEEAARVYVGRVMRVTKEWRFLKHVVPESCTDLLGMVFRVCARLCMFVIGPTGDEEPEEEERTAGREHAVRGCMLERVLRPR